MGDNLDFDAMGDNDVIVVVVVLATSVETDKKRGICSINNWK